MKFLRFMLALVLAFALALPASAMTGNNNEPAHYLALGDSLAAGMIQDGSIGKGYTDFLAEMLEEDNLLASYNKGFAVPGAKTTDLLKMLEENVEMPATGTKTPVKINDEIKKADVITLTIGANDVLSSVKFNADGTIDYDLVTVTASITAAAQNVGKVLGTIKTLNPSADVFVMGLYNPKPHLVDYSFVMNMLVGQVDGALKQVTEASDFYFVPVKDVIAANTKEYLPNPNNIHPSEVGYKVIAEQFYPPVKEYIGFVKEPEIEPEPTPIPQPPAPLPTFKDVKPSHWSYEFVGQAAGFGIMKGYADGTFKPNNKLTRVHVTSMLARTLNLTETSKTPYTDISKLAKQTQQEIAAAYRAGLLKEGKKFGPNTPISRVEFAQMVDAAYSYIFDRPYYPEETAPFTDISKLTAEQKRVITLLYDFEISTGDNGKFKPNSTLTRAQAAKMMVIFYGKVN